MSYTSNFNIIFTFIKILTLSICAALAIKIYQYSSKTSLFIKYLVSQKFSLGLKIYKNICKLFPLKYMIKDQFSQYPIVTYYC